METKGTIDCIFMDLVENYGASVGVMKVVSINSYALSTTI